MLAALSGWRPWAPPRALSTHFSIAGRRPLWPNCAPTDQPTEAVVCATPARTFRFQPIGPRRRMNFFQGRRVRASRLGI
jgi:hypothetical protein